VTLAGYARKASTILNRDARIDGNNEPTKPITAPKMSADNIRSGVTLKLKAISLKVAQFEVPVETKFNGSANTIPIAAPITAIDIDSRRNATRMLSPAKAKHTQYPDLFGSSRYGCIHSVHALAETCSTAMINEMNPASILRTSEAWPLLIFVECPLG
jgi:hypothetical protein